MELDALPDGSSGQDPPEIATRLPGPTTLAWLDRGAAQKAPMGPASDPSAPALVFSRAHGCNVWDPDGNRYVDFCAGFGSALLGHGNRAVLGAVQRQAERLSQAMGDVFDSEAKVTLFERLAALVGGQSVQGILGLSGADAVTAAIKTAVLATGRSRLVAFEGSYHGLSYAPLAVSRLRDGYRAPFDAQLNPHITALPFPDHEAALIRLEQALGAGDVALVVLEPILGRGGIRVLGREPLARIAQLTRDAGALLVADEIWTGLGRSGTWLWSRENGLEPDLICLGKGLGGPLPISACLGSSSLMRAWRRDPDVVHTQTHAGNPLACASAIATLHRLEESDLVARSRKLGAAFKASLESSVADLGVEVRGEGLMLALDFGARPGFAVSVMQALLRRGFITSTGGGQRDTVILTPPLVVEEALLDAFADEVRRVVEGLPA